MKNTIFLFLILLNSLIIYPQTGDDKSEYNPTFYFGFSSLVKNNLIVNHSYNQEINNTRFEINDRGGYSLGMGFKFNYNEYLSLQSGIEVFKRSYNLSFSDDVSSESGEIKILKYNIPLEGLVYIKLNNNIYLRTVWGGLISYLPSDLESSGENYKHLSLRHKSLKLATNLGIGLEHRTTNYGNFYLGVSYKEFINEYLYTNLEYKNEATQIKLSGESFALDFRYYFPTGKN